MEKKNAIIIFKTFSDKFHKDIMEGWKRIKMGILLVIIYLTFISLGLPDSLLGSAWPAVYQELEVPFSAAGIVSMLFNGGTIISSFFSGRLIQRLGTGKLTIISVLMTAAALLGISFTPHFLWICIMTIPLSLGAGAVDAGLNHFVAVHYKASHMSWLHCFWGIGATAGPVIMSFYVGKGAWRGGYLNISLIQFCISLVLLFSLSLWKRETEQKEEDCKTEETGLKQIFKTKGLKIVLVSFLAYCGLEASTGLWASSYLVNAKGISVEAAARGASLFYLGITAGRFISGFITVRIGNLNMIRIGILFGIAGVGLLLFGSTAAGAMLSLVFIGVGCAPVYPAMLHETPNRFGAVLSQSVMGIQMAVAYIGSTFLPPLFGMIASKAGIFVYPVYLAALVTVLLITSEAARKVKAE